MTRRLLTISQLSVRNHCELHRMKVVAPVDD
jgi:hypothetical protein